MQGNNQNQNSQNNNQTQVPSFESGFEFSVPSENQQRPVENSNQPDTTKQELAKRLDALKGITPKENTSNEALNFQNESLSQSKPEPSVEIKTEPKVEPVPEVSSPVSEPQVEPKPKIENEIQNKPETQTILEPKIEEKFSIQDSNDNFSAPDTAPSNLNLENIPEFKPKEESKNISPNLDQAQNQLPKVESLEPPLNNPETKTFSEEPEKNQGKKEEEDTQSNSSNPAKPKTSGTKTKPKDDKKKKSKKKDDNNAVKASGVLKTKGKVVLNADVYEKILWSILHHYSGNED